MSEHTEQEDLEILAKSDLLVPDSLTMRELADHFMELWGEHLADTQAMDGVSDDEVAAATRQMGRVVDRLVNQETAVAGTVFTRTDVELMADWSAMDDIASLSTIGGLAEVVAVRYDNRAGDLGRESRPEPIRMAVLAGYDLASESRDMTAASEELDASGHGIDAPERDDDR